MMNFGLLGHNISYSKSPILHQAIAKAFHLELSYALLDVDETDLREYIEKLKDGTYHGFNVTIPFKEKIIPLLDELSPSAKKIGAVNTIYYRDDKIYGDNTDYDGFLGTLVREKIDIKHLNVCILGSGGAAKACYHVLKDLNVNVKVATRRKIEYPFHHVINYSDIHSNMFDLYVQATPVGTYPNITESILPKELVKDKIVIDLIYNPLKTQIIKDSKRGISGIQMMIIQALRSEEIWHHQKLKLTETIYKDLKEVMISE